MIKFIKIKRKVFKKMRDIKNWRSSGPKRKLKTKCKDSSKFYGSPNLKNIRWCYIDVQGWFYRKEETNENLMGAMNIRMSLLSLHAECEALIWMVECMKTLHISEVMFAIDFSIGEDDIYTDMTSFCYTKEFTRYKDFFTKFGIQHILRAQNTMADKVRCGAWNLLFYYDLCWFVYTELTLRIEIFFVFRMIFVDKKWNILF